MALLAWVVLGFIAGAIAKMLYPGHQGGGLLSTIALGVIGSIIGGYLAHLALGVSSIGVLSFGSILSAIAGSMLIIFVWYSFIK